MVVLVPECCNEPSKQDYRMRFFIAVSAETVMLRFADVNIWQTSRLETAQAYASRADKLSILLQYSEIWGLMSGGAATVGGFWTVLIGSDFMVDNSLMPRTRLVMECLAWIYALRSIIVEKSPLW